MSHGTRGDAPLPGRAVRAICLAMQGAWADISANLKNILDSGVFRVWIAPLRATVDGSELRLTVPSAFMAEWLERHLLKTLREAAAPVLGVAPEAVRVRLLIARDAGEAVDALKISIKLLILKNLYKHFLLICNYIKILHYWFCIFSFPNDCTLIIQFYF